MVHVRLHPQTITLRRRSSSVYGTESDPEGVHGVSLKNQNQRPEPGPEASELRYDKDLHEETIS